MKLHPSPIIMCVVYGGIKQIEVALCGMALLTSCEKETPTPQKASSSPTRSLTKPVSVPEKSPSELQKVADFLTKEPTTMEGARLRIEIVKRIGAERRVEAIPILLDQLLQISPFSSPEAGDFLRMYPCAAALVSMGEHAVQQVQDRLLAASSHLEQLVLLNTLIQIKSGNYVVTWLDGLPDKGGGSLQEQRRIELKQWILSQSH